MGVSSSLTLGFAALLLAVAPIIMFVRHQGRQLRIARAERDRACGTEATVIRALRLAAIELRAPATALLGHADRLGAQGVAPQPAAAIRTLATHILDLADDLQTHALADASGRVLHDAPTPLAPLLDDAVAAAQAGLAPSRRCWRLPAERADLVLLVDPRAIAQVLARVLSRATRFSRHDDWIDISLETSTDRFTLVIADEGTGLSAAEGAGIPGRPDSRGLGLGLALARVLMEAHGGALVVEVAQAVGTRVLLDFPIARLLQLAPPLAAPAEV